MSEEIDNKPIDASEAAIDAATGYKPGDENGGAEAAEVRTVDETKPGEETGGAEAAIAQPETASVRQQEGTASVQQQEVGETGKAKKKHNWVNEAYECFIKNAVDLEPTNPKEAVWEYFKKNATDELKAKVEAEGKTGESCWKFIEAVARKALGGRSGHIDPVAVYAIAMHYFQDVPKDWDKAEAKPKVAEVHASIGKKAAETRRKNAQELKVKKERVKEKEKKPKAKKRGGEQGFFFDLMETEPVVGKEDIGMDADAQGGKEAGDAE